METFGEKISTEACSGKGDSRFTEEDDDDDDDLKNREIPYERILAWQTGGR